MSPGDKHVLNVASNSPKFSFNNKTHILPIPENVSFSSNETNLRGSGDIDLQNGSVRLQPFWLLQKSNLTSLPDNSSFAIAVLDSNDSVLASYPFIPKEGHLDLGYSASSSFSSNGSQFGSFEEVVPFVQGTKKIIISNDHDVLTSRSVKAFPPTITLNSTADKDYVRLSWNAADTEGNSSYLAYTIYYSSDSGMTWLPIVLILKLGRF